MIKLTISYSLAFLLSPLKYLCKFSPIVCGVDYPETLLILIDQQHQALHVSIEIELSNFHTEINNAILNYFTQTLNLN